MQLTLRKNVKFNKFTSHSLKVSLTHWELVLVNFVCDFIECVDFYSQKKKIVRKGGLVGFDEKGQPRKATVITFFGSEDECEMAKDLFEELQSAVAAITKVKYGQYTRTDGATYAMGFVRGIQETHAKTILDIAQSDKATHDLMIVSSERALALKDGALNWLNKEHGVRIKNSTRRSKMSGSTQALLAGKKDGRSYEVNKPSVTKKLN